MVLKGTELGWTKVIRRPRPDQPTASSSTSASASNPSSSSSSSSSSRNKTKKHSKIESKFNSVILIPEHAPGDFESVNDVPVSIKTNGNGNGGNGEPQDKAIKSSDNGSDDSTGETSKTTTNTHNQTDKQKYYHPTDYTKSYVIKGIGFVPLPFTSDVMDWFQGRFFPLTKTLIGGDGGDDDVGEGGRTGCVDKESEKNDDDDDDDDVDDDDDATTKDEKDDDEEDEDNNPTATSTTQPQTFYQPPYSFLAKSLSLDACLECDCGGYKLMAVEIYDSLGRVITPKPTIASKSKPVINGKSFGGKSMNKNKSKKRKSNMSDDESYSNDTDDSEEEDEDKPEPTGIRVIARGGDMLRLRSLPSDFVEQLNKSESSALDRNVDDESDDEFDHAESEFDDDDEEGGMRIKFDASTCHSVTSNEGLRLYRRYFPTLLKKIIDAALLEKSSNEDEVGEVGEGEGEKDNEGGVIVIPRDHMDGDNDDWIRAIVPEACIVRGGMEVWGVQF